MVHMRQQGYSQINAKPESEDQWARLTNEACYQTLMPHNKTSWYMGGNVQGRDEKHWAILVDCLSTKSF
ncbi:FAD/NAD(P)-binding domain-containing protein [Penicillium malachiteum]|nr:FAD/NAD(P)-binding domain-containing protein [Penicillium malachiteum]